VQVAKEERREERKDAPRALDSFTPEGKWEWLNRRA
jgi:hypothetical protein